MNLQVIENIDLYQLPQAPRETDREKFTIALQHDKTRRDPHWWELWPTAQIYCLIIRITSVIRARQSAGTRV